MIVKPYYFAKQTYWAKTNMNVQFKGDEGNKRLYAEMLAAIKDNIKEGSINLEPLEKYMSDEEPEVREDFCWALRDAAGWTAGSIGKCTNKELNKNIRVALNRFLDDPDKYVKFAALSTLQEVGTSEDAHIGVKFLDDDYLIRNGYAVVRFLGSPDDKELLSDLINVLDNAENYFAKDRAVELIKEVGFSDLEQETKEKIDKFYKIKHMMGSMCCVSNRSLNSLYSNLNSQ